jgi:hypothetical protein
MNLSIAKVKTLEYLTNCPLEEVLELNALDTVNYLATIPSNFT